jgi:hypothetical protein
MPPRPVEGQCLEGHWGRYNYSGASNGKEIPHPSDHKIAKVDNNGAAGGVRWYEHGGSCSTPPPPLLIDNFSVIAHAVHGGPDHHQANANGV